MKIHILGVGGTFMAGVAVLAKALGHQVTGMDESIYSPMREQLESAGIDWVNGYDPAHLPKEVDIVIVGNVIRRGNPVMERVLSERVPYISGPAWLAEYVLKQRFVLAVSGTHGKTTTSSLLAWLLAHAGHDVGFLIGGIPENFGVSARLGTSPFFVIEADEYDSAFFDKRSKFIHYHPSALIINNVEYDHADIFPDLNAIIQQFHYLVRTVPGNGVIVCAENDSAVKAILDKGCWTPVITFGSPKAPWRATNVNHAGQSFHIEHGANQPVPVKWSLMGEHNRHNALAAAIVAEAIGVSLDNVSKALASFKNVKRRLELKCQVQGVTVYDDFAHHPTAIRATLQGLRDRVGSARLFVLLEFSSYTMKTGVHKSALASALSGADWVGCKQPVMDWGLAAVLQALPRPTVIEQDYVALVASLCDVIKPGDHVLVMSNSAVETLHAELRTQLGLISPLSLTESVT